MAIPWGIRAKLAFRVQGPVLLCMDGKLRVAALLLTTPDPLESCWPLTASVFVGELGDLLRVSFIEVRASCCTSGRWMFTMLVPVTDVCKVPGSPGSSTRRRQCLHCAVPTRPNFSYSWAGSRVQRAPSGLAGLSGCSLCEHGQVGWQCTRGKAAVANIWL